MHLTHSSNKLSNILTKINLVQWNSKREMHETLKKEISFLAIIFYFIISSKSNSSKDSDIIRKGL